MLIDNITRKYYNRKKMAVKKDYKKLDVLMQRLKKYSSCFEVFNNGTVTYFPNKIGYDEKQAKQDLLDFFAEYKKLKPEKELRVRMNDYYFFANSTVNIMRLIHSGEYCIACGEMFSFYHKDYLLQKRIYLALMGLYRQLEEQTNV